MMKKIALTIAVAAVMGVASQSANAALATNAVLSIDQGVGSPGGTTSGSGFSMEVSKGYFIHTQISGFDGITLGVAQPTAGSHTGGPDGSESPSIDNPWSFFGSTGMHGSLVPVTVATDNGAGNATLNMTGWTVDWNAGLIDMGQGANAVMTCANTCENGDTYSLDYAAVVPSGAFIGVNYAIHLEGTVSAVPVPAAVWLFGSGLVGLVGVARRKAKA